MRYLYVIEKAADGSFSADVPDLTGCTTSGETVDEVKQSIKSAVELYIESLREHNEPVPPPSSVADVVEAAAPKRAGRNAIDIEAVSKSLLILSAVLFSIAILLPGCVWWNSWGRFVTYSGWQCPAFGIYYYPSNLVLLVVLSSVTKLRKSRSSWPWAILASLSIISSAFVVLSTLCTDAIVHELKIGGCLWLASHCLSTAAFMIPRAMPSSAN